MLEDVQAGSEVNNEALAENVSVVLFGRGADGTVTEEHNSENVAEVVGRGASGSVIEEHNSENVPAEIAARDDAVAATKEHNSNNVPAANAGRDDGVAVTKEQNSKNIPAAVARRGAGGAVTEKHNSKNVTETVVMTGAGESVTVVSVEKGPDRGAVPRADGAVNTADDLTNAVAGTRADGSETVVPVQVPVTGAAESIMPVDTKITPAALATVVPKQLSASQKPTGVSCALDDSGIDLGEISLFFNLFVRPFSFNATPYESNRSYLIYYMYLQAQEKLAPVNMLINM